MKLLDKTGKEIDNINFDEVFVGDVKEVEYFLYNDTGTEVSNIDIKLYSEFSELLNEIKVIEYPKFLTAEDQGSVRIKWTPSLKIKKALNVKIRVSGIETWRP